MILVTLVAALASHPVQEEPGMVRARELVAAMNRAAADPDTAGAEALGNALQATFDAFLEEEALWHGASARYLAQAMHDHARATWSAVTLAAILRRLGEYEAAENALLGAQSALGAGAPGAEGLGLIEARAILAGGAGWIERSRDLLGTALGRGGSDAYQMLGRMALAAGAHDRARSLFRVLLVRSGKTPEGEAAGPPWALRGWGLALLPVHGDP